MILQSKVWTEVTLIDGIISIPLFNDSGYRMIFLSKETQPVGVPTDAINLDANQDAVYFAYESPIKLWVYLDAPYGKTGILSTGIQA